MSGIPTYDAVVIPEHVQAILITGAGGFVGQKLTQLLLKLAPKHVKLITTDVVEPPNHGVTDTNRLKVVKADLGKPEVVKSLFEGEKVGIVYALHGIMSGGSEVNFDLGYAVNVDSNLSLLRTAYAHAQATGQAGPDAKHKLSYVFVSSLAVYGGPKCKPTDRVVPQDTPVVPGTSYGIEKSIVELYVFDYGRRGWLDAKSVRLPTVCIRSGAPSTAASSFISGLIREPLQGQPSELPIASGPDDPMLDNMPVYITKVSTVIRNIAFAGVVDDAVFNKGESRSVNLPGVSITPRQILKALEQHGGQKAVDLVSYKVDKQVLAICETWAGDYDSSDAQRQGFQVDSRELGYGEAVEEFKAEAGL